MCSRNLYISTLATYLCVGVRPMKVSMWDVHHAFMCNLPVLFWSW